MTSLVVPTLTLPRFITETSERVPSGICPGVPYMGSQGFLPGVPSGIQPGISTEVPP